MTCICATEFTKCLHKEKAMTLCVVKENKFLKILESDDCNYVFRKKDGLMCSWGKTTAEDPSPSKVGPFILDMEISTICKKNCSFCYKGNTTNGTYMRFSDFKKIFDKLPKALTQIAFGIGDLNGNPDLYKIMRYCRENDVVPNITINGDDLTNYHSYHLAGICGAVAVSHYDNDTCLNAVRDLKDQGLEQVNIHKLLSEETMHECNSMIDDYHIDQRWKNVNAIVFLWLKPIGPRNDFKPVSRNAYKYLVNRLLINNIPFGFDSCTAPMFLEAIYRTDNYEKMKTLVEPCESSLFSYYINVDGIGFPCSFTEDKNRFKGIDVLNCKDFIKDVWKHSETEEFRKNCVDSTNFLNCRKCQAFNL